ncbi:MAG: YlmH/Sll1252 family protein [Oscillospiraceae bacterium]|nr:YlmH/Sll1252 family protein [Oscillospiraceae bacterium]
MEDKIFISHLEDLAREALKSGVSHSKFLTPAELEKARQRYNARRDVKMLADGGFETAERRIAVFLDPERGEFERKSAISALELSHRPQDALSHRDVLGAVLSLGIEREVLGDILIEPL